MVNFLARKRFTFSNICIYRRYPRQSAFRPHLDSRVPAPTHKHTAVKYLQHRLPAFSQIVDRSFCQTDAYIRSPTVSQNVICALFIFFVFAGRHQV